MKIISTIFLILFSAVFCYYDPNPPADEDLYDEREILIINLKQCSAGSRVFIRYQDSEGNFTYPSTYALYTRPDGSFTGRISLSHGSQSASVILYVDENNNGQIDATDFGIFKNNIALNTAAHKTQENINCASGTLLSAAASNITPVGSGYRICVYVPALWFAWQAAESQNLPNVPNFEEELLLTDWFPASIVDTAGSAQNTFLPAGTYDETCIEDTNGNQKYDSGESVNTTSGITL